jgi:protein-S-isoprenylcysteine O-methyltransferase Ste14
MTALTHHFVHHRIAWSRSVFLALIVLVAIGSPPKVLQGWPAELSEFLGYFLLVAATLWRVWCLVFIGGSKNGELTTSGPYSVVRNPLYVGNFLGTVGFCFAIEQPLVALVIGVLFIVAYTAVVAREEFDLERLFGDAYLAYRASVPRWIPDWSRYNEPEKVQVSPPHLRRGILDAMWFLWAYDLWEFVETLHQAGILPTYF